jgi:hypothetical protein
MNSQYSTFDDSWSEYAESAEQQQEFISIENLPRTVFTSSMHRVSSCYFSVDQQQQKGPPELFVHHDVLMNVFDFLDIPSLRAVSETSCKSNFECFYYLLVKLQHNALSELAELDLNQVHEIVRGYRDSNTFGVAVSGLAYFKTRSPLARMMKAAYTAAYGTPPSQLNLEETYPDPYEHTTDSDHSPQFPSGSVGAYQRALQQAHTRIRAIRKEQRKTLFYNLSNQQQVATEFIQACRDDTNSATILQLLPTMHVDGFFIVNNNNNNHADDDAQPDCALHTAAFSNSTIIINILCEHAGADVDIEDENGWTALHYCRSAESARSLLNWGARADIVAANGYTAAQWAARLHYEDVVQELLLSNNTTIPTSKWNSITSRFHMG